LLNVKDRITRKKNQSNHEKSLTINGVNALTREIEHLRRDTDVDKKKIIDLIRFRDMMSKSISKAVDENDKNKEDISKMQTKISLLHQQNNSKQENIFELLQQIYSLEKERDRFSLEASKANSSLMQVVEEVKLKQNLITELKKENIEFEGKLKQQQNLYEAVRADRNLYSKNLIEAQDNVAELRRKFVIASHQISQLKDEIDTKDDALADVHYKKALLDKQIDKIKQESEAWKEKFNMSDKKMIQQQQENATLRNIITKASEEIEKLKKDYQNVINERDILGTQLIRRNDELALLYEKIKILQKTLQSGEVQYTERLLDIKLLKFKIGDHKSELRIVKSQAS
jgi:chromosome segregation ATPase